MLILHHSGRQLTAGAAIAVTGHVVTEHHGALLQGFGEQTVVIQTRLHLTKAFSKARLVLHFVGGQLAQALQTRAVIGLGKQHVKAENRDLLLVKQLVDQIGHFVAPPRPPPHFCQAFFINVDDDDAIIHGFGHGGAQAGVVDDVIEALEHANRKNIGGMQQRQNQGNQRDRNSRPMFEQLLHAAGDFV